MSTRSSISTSVHVQLGWAIVAVKNGTTAGNITDISPADGAYDFYEPADNILYQEVTWCMDSNGGTGPGAINTSKNWKEGQKLVDLQVGDSIYLVATTGDNNGMPANLLTEWCIHR